MTKHTEGPWSHDYGIVRDSNGDTTVAICNVFSFRGLGDTVRVREKKEDHANGRLIAVAPEMLALLEELKWDLATERIHINGYYHRIKELIAKVEGKDEE